MVFTFIINQLLSDVRQIELGEENFFNLEEI